MWFLIRFSASHFTDNPTLLINTGTLTPSSGHNHKLHVGTYTFLNQLPGKDADPSSVGAVSKFPEDSQALTQNFP